MNGLQTERRMLWIHGWGMHPEIWPHYDRSEARGHAADQARGLVPGWHSFFSYHGCGSIQQMAERLKSSIQEEKPNVLVGWSLGGMLALQWLAERLERGEGRNEGRGEELPVVVLVGTTLRFVDRERKSGWPKRILERMLAKLGEVPEAVLEQFAVSMLAEAEQEDKGLQQRVKAAARRTDFAGEGLQAGLAYLIESDLRSSWAEHLIPALQNSRLRLLWIHGEADPVCPLGAVPDRVEGLQKCLVSGAGHLPFLTQEGIFYERIKEFAE
ncbi:MULTISPECIES: alpha/beta fold hydrolase [Paenibacillus]|uniref:alpha/beta fold hydrolase n=1 Tax=Paenibacillus TaxID=44249 RepID=UPI0022B85C5F|nr:alpha/beta fold hydrolase [Paenibacillus caseinilyticus]MCZ8523066.1 alpha/beta fold hydrolase [Paenibacillus caseinilyticus]